MIVETFSMGTISGIILRTLKLMGLLVTLAIPAYAQAPESSAKQNQRPQPKQGQQQQDQSQQGQPQETTASGKTVKQPPPPLFRKHRRGIYMDASGMPIIDAAPQSPPLETDDPGVPDKGEVEINFTTHADLSKPLRRMDFLFVDANYGLLPKVFGHELPTQLKFEFPLASAKAPGDAMRVGIGAAKFGLKFNFYNDEHRGVYISVYPQLEFVIAGTHAVEKGLEEPGQTLILPLLVQKEFRHFTIVTNAGVNLPIHNPEDDTTSTLGFGVGRALTRHVAAMAEVRISSTFDLERERLVVVNFGMMRRITDTVILYAKVGRSIFADDGAHTYIGVGIKFKFTPNEQTRGKSDVAQLQ